MGGSVFYKGDRVSPTPSLPDDYPLEAVALRTRTANALSWDYKTVGQVRRAADAELSRIRNIGKAGLKEIRDGLGYPAGSGITSVRYSELLEETAALKARLKQVEDEMSVLRSQSA
jgi:DNA-directed RNA polymerase alpha subunit